MKAKPVERIDLSSSTSDHPKARASLKRDFLSRDYEKQVARKTEEIMTASSEKTSTPLERYIIRTEEIIQQKRSAIQQLRDKIHKTEEKLERVKSDLRDRKIYRNCHLRLGHSFRTCDYGKCASVYRCGEEKFHPGEQIIHTQLNIKEMRGQMKKNQSDLNKLVEELDSKKRAVETVKDEVSNRIESDLFHANKTEYMVNGNKNWSLLRKHVYLVEEYCKKNFGGKIPGKQDIKSILEKALVDNYSRGFSFYRSKQSGSCKRENPAKPLLERHDIEFPSTLKRHDIEFPCSKHACNSSSTEKLPSQILYTAPKSKGDEAEQLAMVIRESLRQQSFETQDSVKGCINPAYDLSPPPQPPVSFPGFNHPVGTDAMCYPPMSLYSMQYNRVSADYPHRTCTVTCTSSTASTKTAEYTSSAKEESSDVEAASLLLSLSSHQS